MKRTASLTRETRETQIALELDLDGAGSYDVETPIRFLSHMVETLARFGAFDLKLRAGGDDDHHIIEDVAITLGRTLREAMSVAHAPVIRRFGHAVVPMDDALVAVTVDLVDRPFAETPLPDPMYQHFFRSLAMEARFTLHTVVQRGTDVHHTVEAAFKALGLALREALQPGGQVDSSTKGSAQWQGKSGKAGPRG